VALGKTSKQGLVLAAVLKATEALSLFKQNFPRETDLGFALNTDQFARE
jgi:hypothetical protein